MRSAPTSEPPSTAAEGNGATRFQAPRPLRSAALALALGLVPAALWTTGFVPPAAALGVGVAVVVFGLGQGCLEAYDLSRSRRLGDAALWSHPGERPVLGLAAWRWDELTSARRRGRLTRHVRQLRREIEACVSLDSPQLGDDVLPLVLRLESRLDLGSGPARAIGILEVASMVEADLSPLYYPERAGQLPTALGRALAALGPER